MKPRALSEREVVLLPTGQYAARVAYFTLTAAVVLSGTVLAVEEIVSSPLDLLYVLPVAILATALGANTANHMYFTHGAFKATPGFRIVLAILGSLLCQDSLSQWVANHRRHHRHVDVVEADPHTPRQFGDQKWRVFTIGLLWASGGWKFARTLTSTRCYATDLARDSVVRWFDRYYVAVSYSGFVLPFVLGTLHGGLHQGLVWFAYFGALRVFLGYFFVEFVVNGLCHCAGSTKFAIGGNSRNIEPLSFMTLGATLHHNHHAFASALSPAVDGELDPMNLLYKLLIKAGLISNTYVPSADVVLRRKAARAKSVKEESPPATEVSEESSARM